MAIDINKLTEEDIGRKVIYKTPYKEETGILKSFNKYYVYVVYNCGDDWSNYKDYTAAATMPEDLDFI